MFLSQTYSFFFGWNISVREVLVKFIFSYLNYGNVSYRTI